MLVRAKKMGYYNHKRVRENEEFLLRSRTGMALGQDGKTMVEKEFTAAEQFSPLWMEAIDEDEIPLKKSALLKSRKALRQSDDVI